MANELLLRADDISYSQGKRLILDRISFELRRAQITTIIGPNGAGKSTLTNVVNGLIDNYTGKIERSPGAAYRLPAAKSIRQHFDATQCRTPVAPDAAIL